MKDLFWLSGFYFTQFRNRLLNPGKEGIIKWFLVVVFAAMFFPIVYQLFFFLFKHFYSVPLIGGLLVNKLLNAFFMTFSVMILLSSVVSAIPVLYLSKDMDFLFSAPIKIETIFATQCVKIITGASWMIVLMSVPIFGAFARVVKISLGQYLFILLAHIPFCVVLACLGIVLTILLVRYFPAENVRNIALAFLGIFVAIGVVYFRMLQPEKLTGASFDQVSEFVKNLRTPDAFWMPHTHFVRIVHETSMSGVYQALGPFLVYFSISLGMLAAVIMASKYLYFEGYGRQGQRRKEKPLSPGYRYEKHPVFISQLVKDSKYLLRDTSQWIQVVFLFGIVFIYLFNLYKLPAELFNLKDFIFFLNIGFIGLVLSAVGARLILPVISNEGKGFWMFKTAPLTIRRYILYKFIVYSVPLIILGQIVALISVIMLKSNDFINYITFYSTFLITLVISAVGIGFGAFFANFNIKNPEQLITGVAGLSYMFVSFIFVAAVLGLEAGIVKDFYMSRMVKALVFRPQAYAFNFIMIAFTAAVVSALAMWAGIRKLEKIEI